MTSFNLYDDSDKTVVTSLAATIAETLDNMEPPERRQYINTISISTDPKMIEAVGIAVLARAAPRYEL
jgi:hypothetical protein